MKASRVVGFARRCARSAFLLATLVVARDAAWAQQELSELRGTAWDPQGGPVPGAHVALLDQRGVVLDKAICDAEGRFLFKGVAPGSYYVTSVSGALASPLRRVVLGNALAVDIDLRLAVRSAESVVVTQEHETPALATRTSLSGESVRDIPARQGGRGLSAAVASTAGWATEDNGLIHVRGVDEGVLFVIDGVPLYERFDVLFGISPEPGLVASLNVITGHLPAEFGLKSGGVIEINTSSPKEHWSGVVEATRGSERTGGANGQATGPLGKNAGLVLYGSGVRSDRFLDPVDPRGFHNQGSSYQGEAKVILQPSPRDWLTVGMRYGGANFDVPNTGTQEAAGQDQHQGLSHALPLASWQRGWSAQTVSQLAVVGSFMRSHLAPSPNDIPLSTTARRAGERLGLLASVTHGLNRHILKGGFDVSRIHIDEAFAFRVTDAAQAAEANLSEGALQFDAAHPFRFAGARTGFQLSGYLQDTWRALPGLAADFGLRFDRSALPSPETNWGPRVGVAYRLGPKTTLRASVNGYFQPPQLEWLLLSSSAPARVLSPFPERGLPGGAEPRAERQTGVEIGAERWLGDVARVDLALWRRRATNVSDPNLFMATTIVFPDSVGQQRAKGLDLRLEVPRRRGFGGYLSYTLSKADQYGPITGGLFLEDDFLEIGPGTRFTPDHDQRHVGVLGARYEREGRFWLEWAGRYESGTPVQGFAADLEELMGRPGADRVDFNLRRVRPRAVLDVAAGRRLFNRGGLALDGRVEVLNVTNAAYAFNFGNPFSGTHFGPPRTLAVRLRLGSTERGPTASHATGTEHFAPDRVRSATEAAFRTSTGSGPPVK